MQKWQHAKQNIKCQMEKLVRQIYETYDCAEHLDATQFSLWCLKHLNTALAFDSGAITSFIPNEKGQMAIASQVGHNVDADKVRLRHEILGSEGFVEGKLHTPDPLLRKMVLAQDEIHSCHVPEAQHASLHHYASLTGSLNALGASAVAGNVLLFVSAWRAKEQYRFDAHDMHQARQIVPHALKALAINRKLSLHPLLEHKSSSQIYCNTKGDIIHYDESAIYLLRREFPYWLAGNLPHEVLNSILTSSSYRSAVITISVIAKQESVLHLSICNSALNPLTKTELRIVEMVVRHNSLKKVALEMGSSVNTVRNQVSTIYRKLGIQSKTALINHYHQNKDSLAY